MMTTFRLILLTGLIVCAAATALKIGRAHV